MSGQILKNCIENVSDVIGIALGSVIEKIIFCLRAELQDNCAACKYWRTYLAEVTSS